jgi:D-3-phosphoglycerate dehydrogenase/glyoxylate/hydroxypyruvate reductase A
VFPRPRRRPDAAGSARSILVLATSSFVERQLAALRELAPGETILTDPATAPPADVEALLAFRLAPGIASRFPALRFIGCPGAGVDELLAAPDLPPAVPITRAADPLQGTRMAQYVALMALRFFRDLPVLEAQQRAARWQRPAARPESAFGVGVMGCGTIGAPIVDVLARLGFPVAVWTRSPRAIPGAANYAGVAGLAPFLAASRILVCALPLTGQTRGLVSAAAFAALPVDACLINVSRGAVVREDDLVAALDGGRLGAAVLDVFATEPLPAASPLWRHPRILVTPHIAGEPRAKVAAAQFLANLRHARRGEPLDHVVDRARGY